MKYVLMFASPPEIDAAVPADRAARIYGEIEAWFRDNADAITDPGVRLQPGDTATTIAAGDGGATVVTDGTYSEAKEVIGGFTVIDVPDLDAAIALARTWPPLAVPGVVVEVRPAAGH